MQYIKLSCNGCKTLFYFPEIEGNTDTYVKCPACRIAVEIRKQIKIEGIVTLIWADGHEEDVCIGQSARGFILNGERPIDYFIDLSESRISSYSLGLKIRALYEYINNEILPALEKK